MPLKSLLPTYEPELGSSIGRQQEHFAVPSPPASALGINMPGRSISIAESRLRSAADRQHRGA